MPVPFESTQGSEPAVRSSTQPAPCSVLSPVGVPAPWMLAFDLETTGLDPEVDRITCACVYAGDGAGRVYFFGGDGRPGEADDTPEAFFALLDAASRLCAFNGARFDIPFLQIRYGLSDARVGAWVLKLCDLYEACRLAFDSGFSLNALLAANGMESKTGTGGDAVQLARDGRWDELAAYCLQDAAKTHVVSSLGRVLLPTRRMGNVAWARGPGFERA